MDSTTYGMVAVTHTTYRGEGNRDRVRDHPKGEKGTGTGSEVILKGRREQGQGQRSSLRGEGNRDTVRGHPKGEKGTGTGSEVILKGRKYQGQGQRSY